MPWAYAGCTPPHLSDVVEIKACNTFLMLVPTPNNPGSGSREKGARLQIPVSLITKVDAVNSSRVPQQRSRQHQRPVTSRCSGDTQPRVYHSLQLPDLGAGQDPAGNSDTCFLPDLSSFQACPQESPQRLSSTRPLLTPLPQQWLSKLPRE